MAPRSTVNSYDLYIYHRSLRYISISPTHQLRTFRQRFLHKLEWKPATRWCNMIIISTVFITWRSLFSSLISLLWTSSHYKHVLKHWVTSFKWKVWKIHFLDAAKFLHINPCWKRAFPLLAFRDVITKNPRQVVMPYEVLLNSF